MLSVNIHNLLDNAIKYTIGGEIRATSSGIPDHIFELTNAANDEDTLSKLVNSGQVKGLGLLIVKEVAALVNITVWVSKTDYVRFHLRLPKPGTLVNDQT